jgi:Mn2+/Fe2+ NRAMP family transporter
VKKLLGVALGIIAAIGGFVDIGDLVFNSQAGATFGYAPLWAIPIGVLGIIVFAEMSGRVAAVAKKANFDLVNDHYSRRLATMTLVASLFVNVLTLAAELGGIGIVLNLFFDVSDQFFVVVALLVMGAAMALMSFDQIERVFGYLGLGLMVYLVGSLHLHPDWGDLGNGFVPHFPSSSLYWYFIVGLIAAALMPYEIYFYSSGGIEEGWTEKDLGLNRANAVIGYALGGTLAVAILVASAQVLQPENVNPETIGTTALVAQAPFGETGLVLAGIGIFFAIGGATIDTCFSAAYNLCQHMGWKWGKRHGLRNAPRFTAAVYGALLLGFVIVQTGIDPVELTEYAVVFSAVAMPLTFLPIVLTARNREVMGEHRSGLFGAVVGYFYFGVICVLAVAAPTLLFITNGGGG